MYEVVFIVQQYVGNLPNEQIQQLLQPPHQILRLHSNLIASFPIPPTAIPLPTKSSTFLAMRRRVISRRDVRLILFRLVHPSVLKCEC